MVATSQAWSFFTGRLTVALSETCRCFRASRLTHLWNVPFQIPPSKVDHPQESTWPWLSYSPVPTLPFPTFTQPFLQPLFNLRCIKETANCHSPEHSRSGSPATVISLAQINSYNFTAGLDISQVESSNRPSSSSRELDKGQGLVMRLCTSIFILWPWSSFLDPHNPGFLIHRI